MIYFSMVEEWTTRFATLSEKIFMGTAMLLVGFSIVFIMLVILIICITLMSKSVTALHKKINSTDITIPKVKEINHVTPVKIVHDTILEDHTLVAVITAAIAALLSSESAKSPTYPGFKVREIRRVKENTFGNH